MAYNKNLKIGFIQTVVEGEVAWGSSSNSSPQMSQLSQERAWSEIKKGFIDLADNNETPHIIVLPELSIPLCNESDIRRLCGATGAIVIGGLDFNGKDDEISNKAIVAIPREWPSQRRSKSVSFFYFGKTFYSAEEETLFGRQNLVSHPEIYLLDASKFGKIGIAICSDFFDIERFGIYKGRIHHLIIISHNKDVDSYYFLGEAIARLVYCNVIICNTGEFGDSIAFSPYKESHKRIIYRHKGSGLYSTQVVSLPVSSLDQEQYDGVKNEIFKARPPGYTKY